MCGPTTSGYLQADEVQKGQGKAVQGVAPGPVSSNRALEPTRCQLAEQVLLQQGLLHRQQTSDVLPKIWLRQGHIHGTSKVISIDIRDESWDVEFSVEPFMQDYILHKGYVAINGCSLTVGEVSKESFMIHLIPETLSITNLFQLQKNSIVNVELDQNTIVIADTVKKYLDGKS